MTNPSDAVTNTGRGLERLRRRIALIGNDAYRRDGWRLLLADMRGWLGVRTLLAVVVLAISGAWLAYHSVTTPREAHQLLARLFGFGALLAGAGLFASDQRQGTFELLWLATGSRRKLLAHRIIVQLIAFTLLAVPAILLSRWWVGADFPAMRSLVFIVTNTLLILCTMAWAATLLPQAWAGALMGMALIVGFHAWMGDTVSIFNLFLNPMPGGAEELIVIGGGAFASTTSAQALVTPNRIVVLLASGLLFNMAHKGVARTFRG